jgi:hypothetical protein
MFIQYQSQCSYVYIILEHQTPICSLKLRCSDWNSLRNKLLKLTSHKAWVHRTGNLLYFRQLILASHCSASGSRQVSSVLSYVSVYHLGYGLDNQGVRVRFLIGARDLSPYCRDWLWGPPSLLYSGGCFPGDESGRDVKLATVFCLVLGLRMAG